jgi:superfamily II DNA or RNA helicase
MVWRMPGKLLTQYTSAMLGPLIASAGVRARLDGADLFALAYALAGVPPRLAIEEALDTLTKHGLPREVPRVELAERMRKATHRDPTFIAFNDRSFCLHRHADLDQRITDSLLRAGPVRTRRATDAATGARPAPPPEPRSQAAPRRKEPPRPVSPRAPQRGLSKAAPSGPPPEPTAAASPPPPPPLARAGVSFASLDETAVARMLAAPCASIAEVVHVLRAHALASAERFEELLALRLMPGVEPHRYQIETVRRVLRFFRGRALLADEVGLGKTVEALMILREYQLRGAVRRALVLVPPALVAQWIGELETKAGITPRTTEDAAFRADPEGFWRGQGVVVASLATARAPRHVGAVQAEPWDVLIVDEAHHVKNRATASFKLVDGIKSRYLLLLTATPIETDLQELYNLVTLLKPGQFATPAAFRAQFVDKKDPLSPKNREKLRGLLAEVMVRNTRADSGLRLPPRYVSTVVVDPLPEERELYDAVVSFLRAHAEDRTARMLATTLLLEAGSSPAAVQGTLRRTSDGEKRAPALRAALVTLAGEARAVQATRKGKALVDLVRAHPDQMLVFTRFRDTLDYLERALREAGIEPLAFHGGLGAEAKRAALDAFRGGAKILLATDVGGEGQNLHHCHVLVNFDLPYNPMLIEQRIGRLHRMGQQEEVRVYNLCARGTAEQRVLDLLDRRLHLFELVVGEMDMVLGNLVDERDLEERIVALYAESRTDAEIERGIDAIEVEFAMARGRYEQVKSLDSALFGKDYEA